MLGTAAQRAQTVNVFQLTGPSPDAGSLTLTLGTVAGLAVAALHCGGFGVGATLVHVVQVALLVRADHLPLSRTRSTAPGALEENRAK